MGGSKKSNRTKGNVRPSSSGRSAELLSSSGINNTGFVGFSGLSADTLNYVPATSQVCEIIDTSSAVDGDFRMVMRKMAKKDPITKLKAIQEFSELCQNKDEETLKGALPFWPRLYNQLAMDHDRRVRETTHAAHQQLIKRVGRNLAPHLRSIMGVWLISQCDPYGPSATAAKTAFTEAFPEIKQSEALIYCKDEIFNFIQDNLFNQSPQQLSDPSLSTPEEMENKYHRVIKSSFDGIAKLLSDISADSIPKIEHYINKIIQVPSFWKYAKHKEIMIQISWYNLIVCLCEKVPQCIIPYTSKLCPLTLGSLAQNDPVVTSVTWEAALCLLNINENCWEHVNMKKAFFPQLWIILKSGGQGNAVALFPKLLPLLSKIPDNLIEDKIKFCQNFFGNMRSNLMEEKLQNSPSECNAIIRAFVECIQYVLGKSCDSNESKNMREYIILEQLLPVLKTSIVEDKNYLASSCLYQQIKELLDYIQDHTNEKNLNNKEFEETLTLFWDNFFVMCETLMDNDTAVEDKRLFCLAEFFFCLHCPNKIQKWTHKRKVVFIENKEKINNEITTKPFSVNQSNSVAANYHIVLPTQKLCATVMIKFEKIKNLSYLQLLCQVIDTVSSHSLFSFLLKSSKDLIISDIDAPKEFFYQVVVPWISDMDNIDCDKKIYISCVVNIVVAICSCVKYHIAEDILNDFTKKSFQSKNFIMLECLIKKATNVPKENALKKWFRTSDVGEIIVTYAEELCQVTLGNVVPDSKYIDSVWNILHFCFTTSEYYEPIIDTKYMSRIIEIFHQCLLVNKTNQESKNKKVLEFVCDLTISLFSSFKGYWLNGLHTAEELLLSLFFLSCETTDPSETISEKLTQSWQMGAKHLLSYKVDFLQPDGFFFKAANKIHQQILNNLGSIKGEEKLSISTYRLLKTMYEALENEESEEIHDKIFSLLNIIFPSFEEWELLQNTIDSQYLISAVLDDKLIANDQKSAIISEGLPKYCLAALFVSKILTDMMKVHQSLAKETQYNSNAENNRKFIIKQLPNIILAVTYCNYSNFDYKTTKNVIDKNDKMFLHQELKEKMFSLLSTLDDSSYLTLLDTLCNLSLQKGYLWSLSFGLTMLFEQRESLTKIYLEDILKQINYDNIYHLQTLKVILPYLNLSSLQKMYVEITNLMICTEDLFSAQGGSGLLNILASCLEVKGVLPMLDVQEHIIIILEYFLGIKTANENYFLSNCNLSLKESDHIYFVNNVMSLLEKIVQKLPSMLESKHWDFLLCRLVECIQSCDSSKFSYRNSLAILKFHTQIFSLLSTVSDFMEHLENSEDKEKFPSNLLPEWNDLFIEDLFSSYVPLYIEIAETYANNKYLDIGEEILLKNMSKSSKHISTKQLLKCEFHSNEVKKSDEISTDNVYLLLEHLVPLLTCGVRSVQLGTHFLLMKLMPQLASLMSKREKIDDDKRPLPDIFIKHLQKTEPVVETILLDFRIGDCCILEPYTDSYTYGRAYLLSWIEILEFFSSASSEERSEYASYLHDNGTLHTLLNSLFCLMPHNPSLPHDKYKKSKQHTKTMFTDKPLLIINDNDTPLELQHISCQVYLNALRKLPALIRQWWTNQEKRTSEIVNKFTSNYVSSLICAKEIRSVHDDDKKFKNMTIKARPSAREVVAVYTIDEVTIELLIQLPSNHPLGPVIVESGRRIGVAQTQWRNWMLQLTTFLTHQNGSILEGLALWKRNVDKRFEGVEECMICFYVVHGSTCQLPKLSCRTCKKKFHSACLYKWFNTSNNSSCPLCRNIF